MKNLLRAVRDLKKVKQEFLEYKLNDMLDIKFVELSDIKGVTLDRPNKRLMLSLSNSKRVSLPKLDTEKEALKLSRRLRVIKKIDDILGLADEC
jgi:hypothetical protein